MWMAILFVVFTSGAPYFEKAPIAELTGENSLAACEAFKHDFESANPADSLPPNIDHYRIACVLE